MVEKQEIVSIYRDHKETFHRELDELNRALSEMRINCEILQQADSDGETLIFKKIDR